MTMTTDFTGATDRPTHRHKYFKSAAEAAAYLRNPGARNSLTEAARMSEIADMLDGGQSALVLVDLNTNIATRAGYPERVRLTPTEAEVLSVLADGKPHRKGALMSALYGASREWPETADNGVNVRLSYLRRKLRPFGLTFVCHRGLGGRLESKYQLIERVGEGNHGG